MIPMICGWMPTAFQSEPVQTAVPNVSSNDGSTADFITWESADGCVAVEHYRINGGDHDWPGTFGNMDIVAHEVIWDFVKQYGLSGHLDCTLIPLLPLSMISLSDGTFIPIPQGSIDRCHHLRRWDLVL